MTIEAAETVEEYTGPKITIDGLTLIGIYGKARVGKDTVAHYIQNQYEDVYIRAFADPLKSYCSLKYGIPLDHFYDDELKEQINEYWGISPRKIAQFEGTENTRDTVGALLPSISGNEFWINRFAGAVNGDLIDEDGELIEFGLDDTIVIPDVRFQNEYDFIVANNGMVIDMSNSPPWGHIKGIANHSSEAGKLNLYAKEQTYELINDTSLQTLHDKIDAIMERSIKHRVIYSRSLYI